MKSPFVPLSATSLPKVQKAFVPTVLPPAESCSASSLSPPGKPGATTHAVSNAKPSIELRREGDRVVGITVRCQCGETIEIECVS